MVKTHCLFNKCLLTIKSDIRLNSVTINGKAFEIEKQQNI